MRNPAAVIVTLLALGGTAAFSAGTPAFSRPTASVGPVQIARPFNRAVVRESVPIKLREFPKGGLRLRQH